MTKIIVYIASSLDGYVARENGSIDWLPQPTESSYDAFYKSVDTVIMGRTTYDQVLTFGEYSYKDKKSFVCTRSSCNDDNGIEVISNIEKFVKDGLPNAGENIWLVGGGKLIGSFLKLGVVDEIIITVIPVLLGKGIPLFQGIENDTKLELVKTERYSQLVDLHYKVLK